MAKLRIERIECIPLSIPLPRTFRGSNYFMTHAARSLPVSIRPRGSSAKSTTATSSRPKAEVLKIIAEEIAPLLIGMDAFNIEGCWEAMRKPSYNILRDRKLAMCARPASTAPVGRRGQGPRHAALQVLGRLPRQPPGHLHRRLLRGRQDARRFRPRDGVDHEPRAMPAASSRWAGARRRRMPSGCARRARPSARISY